MQTKLTVLSVEQREFPPRNNKPATKYQQCQCVVHNEPPVVGVLRVYNEMCEVHAGDYVADFGIAVAWDSKEIGGKLIGLRLLPAPPVAKGQAAQS